MCRGTDPLELELQAVETRRGRCDAEAMRECLQRSLCLEHVTTRRELGHQDAAQFAESALVEQHPGELWRVAHLAGTDRGHRVAHPVQAERTDQLLTIGRHHVGDQIAVDEPVSAGEQHLELVVGQPGDA